ncbi:hypothetical protein [Tellurirhabdus rosea]|uniref:hypothetical protein n=1 Tax=Tellurirhabdus rosea TaxID=2674997 RepID=UPI00225A790D|nr:hypothetical protein [Tellurirhabdus rosea]
MERKGKIICLLLASLIPFAVNAQESEVYWRQTNRTQNQYETYIFQLISAGVLPPLSSGPVNYVQSGSSNTVRAQVFGSGNDAVLLQIGRGNEIDFGLNGNRNVIRLIQNGDANLLSLPAIRADAAQLTIVQEGEGNVLRQSSVMLGNGVPILIEQRGGMEIYIMSSGGPQ